MSGNDGESINHEGDEQQENIQNNLNSNNIEQIIQKLEEDRVEASKQANYEIAEQIRLKVSELKIALEMSKRQELGQKHQMENERLDFVFKKEIEDLESRYEKDFSELDTKSKELEEKLNEKHHNEMEELYNYLDMKLPKIVKHSKKYLDLKNQEINLAKQQKYKDAMLIKKQCDTLDQLDTNKFNQEKTEKIKSQSIKTANKHLNEKNALKKRIELEYEELKKKKQTEIQVIVLKYKNKKNELENQHKLENYLNDNTKKLKAMTTTNSIKTKNFIFNTSITNYNTNGSKEEIEDYHENNQNQEENKHNEVDPDEDQNNLNSQVINNPHDDTNKEDGNENNDE